MALVVPLVAVHEPDQIPEPLIGLSELSVCFPEVPVGLLELPVCLLELPACRPELLVCFPELGVGVLLRDGQSARGVGHVADNARQGRTTRRMFIAFRALQARLAS